MSDGIQTVERLHRKYAGILYDKSRRMLGDSGEAEDAVQETFIQAYRSLDSFNYGESHLPWLFRICTNVCLKIIRTRRRKGAVPKDELPESAACGNNNVEEEMHLRRVIGQLADQVDERTWHILVSYFADGLDQEQIAKQLGISRRAVVKRLTKLRVLVNDLIAGEKHV